jgi:hypothetical protein
MPRKPRRVKAPVIAFTALGACVANCTSGICPRGMQPILEFAPAVSNITHRKRAAFLKIVAAIDALEDPDCDEMLDGLLKQLGVKRSKTCLTCRLKTKKSHEKPTTKFGACRAKWYEIRARLTEEGCVECGCNDAMTVEHGIPELKMRNKKSKSVELSDYSKWATLGGPDAMEAELQKEGVVPMCRNCQFMQLTHNAMKPKIDPDTLPDGKRGKDATKEDEAAYNKKHQLVIRREKQAYVDAIKLAAGECAECELRVVPQGSPFSPGHTAYPHAFQFAHRSELDWEHSVSKLVNSCSTLNTVKPKIDKEVARCRVLCQCCGHVETLERASEPGASEEGN